MKPLSFSQVTGMKVVKRQDGESEIHLQITDQHLNNRGITHGGVICTLLDDTIGSAIHSALEDGVWATTADLTIHFMRPAGKVLLRAEGRVIRKGRRLIVGEATVYNPAGEPVAHGVGTWAVVNPAGGSR